MRGGMWYNVRIGPSAGASAFRRYCPGLSVWPDLDVYKRQVLNSRYDSDALTVDQYFNEGFRAFIGLDENTKIDVDYSMSPTFDESAMNEYSYAELAKLTAMISSKGLDVMIGRPDVIDHYGEMDGFLNLEEALPPDLYEQVKDYLYPVTNCLLYTSRCV